MDKVSLNFERKYLKINKSKLHQPAHDSKEKINALKNIDVLCLYF